MRLILAIWLSALPATAQTVDCVSAASQVEMTYCAEQDWQAADVDLNDSYRQAMAVMKEIDAGLPKAEQGAAGQLRAAQRAWVTFRDAGCAAEGFVMHGGTGEPMVIYECRARVTRARSAELSQLAAPL